MNYSDPIYPLFEAYVDALGEYAGYVDPAPLQGTQPPEYRLLCRIPSPFPNQKDLRGGVSLPVEHVERNRPDLNRYMIGLRHALVSMVAESFDRPYRDRLIALLNLVATSDGFKVTVSGRLAGRTFADGASAHVEGKGERYAIYGDR